MRSSACMPGWVSCGQKMKLPCACAGSDIRVSADLSMNIAAVLQSDYALGPIGPRRASTFSCPPLIAPAPASSAGETRLRDNRASVCVFLSPPSSALLVRRLARCTMTLDCGTGPVYLRVPIVQIFVPSREVLKPTVSGFWPLDSSNSAI